MCTCTAVCALYLRTLLLTLQDGDIVTRIHRVHNVQYLRDKMLPPSCYDDLFLTFQKSFIDYDSGSIVAALVGSGYVHRIMSHLYRGTATLVRHIEKCIFSQALESIAWHVVSV
jgi:Component of IIS longevity pathway SMK-1